MGCKQKKSRLFGKGLGRHRHKRQNKHTGRPLYRIIRHGNMRKSKMKLKIQKIRVKVHSTINHEILTGELYESFPTDSDLRIKLRKIKNLTPKGYRIINLDCLQSHISEITMHACTCVEAMRLTTEGKPPIILASEAHSRGLASVMMAQCQGCSKKFRMETSPKIPGSKRFDINVRAVWGSMVTGNGPAHLNEFLGTLNSPGLTHTSFSSIETEIGKWWLAALEKEILKAGQEERKLAIERNDYHQEVPAITVITDGGWSKRTHKHSYNAAGGVAIVIGKETKKLLHIGVRNKYCYICNMQSGKEHECFKNWNEDSQSMEADIILEGFSQAEEKHGVRYMRVVGDGDSSVFARIKQEIPVWGRFVTKEECANHVTKCFRSNLEKLVSDNPMYKGKNNLSKSTRVRLVSSVRCAIRMRSKELQDKKSDRATCIKRLQHDINNSVYHVFGLHTNCSDFCRAKEQQTSTHNNQNSAAPVPSDCSIIGDQIDYWVEGASVEDQDESRFGTSIKYADIEQHIIRDVSQLLSRISEKADRLISNSTTNLAESWMHVRTKFDGGKVHNLCNRGSWHARCYGGALRMNLGPQWSSKVWETSTASEPGYFFRTQYAKQARRLTSAIKYRQKPSTQVLRWKKKVSSLKKSTTKKARMAYGPEALDVTEDVSSSELATLQTKFLDNHVNLSSNQCQIISNSTINQSQSGLWYAERKKRITASNFGLVVKRNPSLPVQKFVKTLLYSTFHGNRHTRNGLLQEDTTIEEYKLKMAEQKENVVIERSGLIIHPQHKYLAGSPDGIVATSGGESGLIEIKNLLHSKPVNLWQASENPSFCLENSNGNLNLKSNHNYYYQCQGLLQICDKNWIDFIVRTLNPHQLFVQRIYRDNDLWENLMLPKLDAFYHKAMLPELASPRHGKCPGIREPGVWFQSQEKSLPKRKRKQPTVTTRRKKKTSKPVSSTDTESEDSKRVIPSLTCQTRRKKTAKFVGRCIRHEWIVDEDTQEKQWYTGTVISLISGCDGHINAVYEVVYDGEDEPYEIDHLMQDYHSGSVTFADI